MRQGRQTGTIAASLPIIALTVTCWGSVFVAVIWLAYRLWYMTSYRQTSDRVGLDRLCVLDDDDIVHLLKAAVKREGSQAALRDAMALTAVLWIRSWMAKDALLPLF
jgi:hypothetical protein